MPSSSPISWILITGSSGFIAQNLIKKLLSNEYHIIGLDIADSNYFKDNENFIFKRINLLDLELENIIKNYSISWIIHLAGISSSKLCSEKPDLAFKINVQGSLNILSAFKNQKSKPHVVLASSSEVYGYRDQIIPLNEESTLLGSTLYAFSKKIAEESWQYFASLYGMNWTIFRFSNTYGRENASQGYVVEYLLDKCIKNQNPNIRTPFNINHFLFLDDHIEAYVKLLANPKVGIFNIAGPDYLSIFDLNNKIRLLFNNDIENSSPTNSEKKILVLDTKKANVELGWNAKITIDMGLMKLKSYFKT